MCNIIHFLFSCQHSARLPRSRCKGTKHKVTRSSVRAACTAECFITIRLQTDCSSCQHKTWQEEWKLKLARAATFLAKLTEKRMPGSDDVAALVKDLNEQYHQASWDARNIFSHALKKNVARVNVSDHRKARSPLLQEVHPEDVADPKKEWTEMDEEDYDDNYVASTDPVHPVSTDYSHPLDDDDGSWMLNHFSPEELEQAHLDEAIAVDFDGHAWSWGDDSVEDTSKVTTEWEEENSDAATGQWDTAGGFIAWGPEANATSSEVLDMDGLRNEKTILAEQVQEVVKAFWEVVNNNNNINDDDEDQQSPHPKTDLSTLLHGLHMSNPSTLNDAASSPPSTPTKTPHQWMDGPSDSPPTSQSSPPISLSPKWSNTPSSTPTSATSSPSSFPPPQRLPTSPSPNSTRARYDKQRRYLKARKQDDAHLTKYYSDWLLVSRLEARDFEGPEGRFVPDPQMVRVGGGKGGSASGWF